MSSMTLHNPDRYMVDLRQILSQGRKRRGLFVGAGAPMAILINGKPLIRQHLHKKSVPFFSDWMSCRAFPDG